MSVQKPKIIVIATLFNTIGEFPAMSNKVQEPKNTRVFVSYLNDIPSKSIAGLLAEILEGRFGFSVFFDVNKLRPTGGVKWDDKLFDEARNTDVLIVLLQPETAKSDWVQREVDTARGANVSILPIKVSRDVDIKDALEKLAIGDLQYLEFEDHNLDYNAIVSSIESLAQLTRRKQNEWSDNLKALRKVKRPETNDPRKASFFLYEAPNVRVHIAQGDMTDMGAIDVLVNSENDYMQMARVFESDTLSSRLRYKGSHIVNKYVRDDTVQRYLDEIIQRNPDLERPVTTTTCVATHAGHAKSKLRRKTATNGDKSGARYIFHVASVNVSPNRDQIIPVSTDDEVIECVNNAFEKVIEVDAAQGVISFEGCETYDDELKGKESYQAIESIILPLFGAGRGGRAATVVIPAMVDGIKRFLLAHRNNSVIRLKDIYLCIYSKSDVDVAEQAFLTKKFNRP